MYQSMRAVRGGVRADPCGVRPDHHPMGVALDSTTLAADIQLSATTLGLPVEFHAECISAFADLLDVVKDHPFRVILPRPRLDASIACSVVAIARRHSLPISLLDASARLGIDIQVLNQAFHHFATLSSAPIGPERPATFLPRALSSLGLPSESPVKRIAIMLIDLAYREWTAACRPGPGLAGAAVTLAWRGLHRRPLPRPAGAKIESELKLTFSNEIDAILVACARLACHLPFDVPFTTESLDMYLPELISCIPQLIDVTCINRAVNASLF